MIGEVKKKRGRPKKREIVTADNVTPIPTIRSGPVLPFQIEEEITAQEKRLNNVISMITVGARRGR